jgi:hypothetical protein
MTEFETIFADPITTVTYIYGSLLCRATLSGWGLLTLRAPSTCWTPLQRRIAFQRR